MGQRVLVLGDAHGNWKALRWELQRHKPDLCIVAGDFGWFPNLAWALTETNGWFLNHLLQECLEICPIHFIDGNHEHHPSLIELAPRGSFEAVEIVPGLVYQPRGSRMQLADGRTIFFAGGGKSVDWRARVENVSWFREEILEREHLPEKLPKSDIVISHTAPAFFGIPEILDFENRVRPGFWDLTPDPSAAILDEVLDVCRPRLWIASHFHRLFRGRYKKTEYRILDMLGSSYKDTSFCWL